MWLQDDHHQDRPNSSFIFTSHVFSLSFVHSELNCTLKIVAKVSSFLLSPNFLFYHTAYQDYLRVTLKIIKNPILIHTKLFDLYQTLNYCPHFINGVIAPALIVVDGFLRLLFELTTSTAYLTWQGSYLPANS